MFLYKEKDVDEIQQELLSGVHIKKVKKTG
jgi:hypothetical protein